MAICLSQIFLEDYAFTLLKDSYMVKDDLKLCLGFQRHREKQISASE
jgi:hypothetical protein